MRAGIDIADDGSVDNTILGNVIYQNGSMGIDLGDDGTVTPNDIGEEDSGANDLLNFPEFNDVSYASGEVTAIYNLDVPTGDYLIEFYQITLVDSSLHGEGEFPSHVETVTHGGTGEEQFSAVFSMRSTAYLTATTTEVIGVGQYGSTSEFSMAISPTTDVDTDTDTDTLL